MIPTLSVSKEQLKNVHRSTLPFMLVLIVLGKEQMHLLSASLLPHGGHSL